MKKPQIKIIIIVGCLLLLAALGVSIWLTLRSKAEHATAASGFKLAQKSLAKFYRMKPFPSPDNVEGTRVNIGSIETNGSLRLSRELRAAQLDPVGMSPSKFKELLLNTTRKLEIAAEKHNVTMAGRFLFGFDAYGADALPVPDAVPRLAQQLLVVQAIVNILFESEIQSLGSVEREIFESGKQKSRPSKKRHPRRARPGAPVPEAPAVNTEAPAVNTDDLYSRQSFVFQFSTRENALTDVMNRLAACDMFVRVRDIDIQAKQDAVRSAITATGLEEEIDLNAPVAPGLASRDARVVSGRELTPLAVRIVIDYYEFKSDGES